MKTHVTEMLQIKYPIIAGNMFNISKPEFVAACSNAGALGILASVMYRTAEPLREAIQLLQSLTDRPFAVNVNLFPMLRPIKQDKLIQVMIDEGVKIIETSGHEAPEKYVPMFKQNDVLWIHKCAGIRYALKAEKLGADIVEVVGWENGGATGRYDIGTLVLAPAAVDALKIPVIAGGGIADGRGLVAVLSLGAQAGLMGTRLLMTTECPIHENLKQALVKSTIYDTTIVMRSVDATHRVWNNEAAKRVAELEASQSGQNEIFEAAAGAKSKLMYDEGDLSAGIVACSQSVGLAKDIIPVQELFDRIMVEAEGIITRLSTL
ncbi:MAG TPA: nitronate monooxygenase [Candidatus Lokiarchaeia archaeon]|nr:nitronate monooxygenase [Candidatus Lokiarchaeia archaeon]